MWRVDLVHVFYMQRADLGPRADALDVRCWFQLQFQTYHPWKPQNRPQSYGGSLCLFLALKLLLESFMHNQKSTLVKILYIPVRTSQAKRWLLKYWWSTLSSKVCEKICVHSLLRSYIYGCVCASVHARAYTMCQERTLSMFYTCKCRPSTKSGHARGLLLVLASDSDSSSFKTQESTIKLWG